MNTNRCVADLVKKVSVNPTLTLSVVGPTVVYMGGTITKTVSGATSYSLNATSTSSVVLYTPQIIVNPSPAVHLYAVLYALCPGGTTTLTTTGTTSYSWSTSSTVSAITLTPATISTYSVIRTNVYNCSTSLSKTVKVNPVTFINVTSSSSLVCSGESVSDCTSLTEKNLNDVYTIYPNPAVNELKISFPGEATINVKVINAIGAIVLEEKNYTSTSSLNISDLSKGIYFVQITSGTKLTLKKIIVE